MNKEEALNIVRQLAGHQQVQEALNVLQEAIKGKEDA